MPTLFDMLTEETTSMFAALLLGQISSGYIENAKVALTQIRQSEALNPDQCVNIGRYTWRMPNIQESSDLMINFHDDMEDFRFVYVYSPSDMTILWEFDRQPWLDNLEMFLGEAEQIQEDLENGFIEGKQRTFEEAMRYFDSVIEEYRSSDEA